MLTNFDQFMLLFLMKNLLKFMLSDKLIQKSIIKKLTNTPNTPLLLINELKLSFFFKLQERDILTVISDYSNLFKS